MAIRHIRMSKMELTEVGGEDYKAATFCDEFNNEIEIRFDDQASGRELGHALYQKVTLVVELDDGVVESTEKQEG